MSVDPPRLVLVLSENWTLTSPRDLRALVRMAQEAEDAGIDSVMLSEHIVLSAAAGAGGIMGNPRDYAAPGNQDPATPWPDSLVLFSAIFSNVTEYFWAGARFGGMSGVVYALFGYVWIKGKLQPHLGIGAGSQTVGVMLVWLVVCMTGAVGPIANAAHVAGLAAGMLVAWAPVRWKRLRQGR